MPNKYFIAGLAFRRPLEKKIKAILEQDRKC
jgi:hypothetical protein